MLQDWRKWGKFGLLTEPQRNSGLIITESARLCLEGKFNPPRVERAMYRNKSNLQHQHCVSDDEIIKALDNFYASHEHTFDPVHDIQVIVAVNERTAVSRDHVNSYLQRRLNPARRGNHNIFKRDDKIICTSNSWVSREGDRLDKPDKKFIANGSIGYVLQSNKRHIIAAMDDHPTQRLMLPTGGGKGDFDLAYAITCHKMQGSEAKCCVTLLGKYLPRVVDRGWLYTAVTRAQDFSVILGPRGTIEKAVRRVGVNDRKSFAPAWFTERERWHEERERSLVLS